MKPFDERWQHAARLAHSTQPPNDDAAPFGFATRVVANWPAPESLWQPLALRMLGAMTALLVLLVVVGTLTDGDGSPLQLPLEDTVGELFWLQ